MVVRNIVWSRITRGCRTTATTGKWLNVNQWYFLIGVGQDCVFVYCCVLWVNYPSFGWLMNEYGTRRIYDEGKRCTRIKPIPLPMSTANLTWSALEANPGLGFEKQTSSGKVWATLLVSLSNTLYNVYRFSEVIASWLRICVLGVPDRTTILTALDIWSACFLLTDSRYFR
jgi:hypothetical protein